MEKTEVIQIKWDFLGAKLAGESDENQANFFIGFANELNSYDTHYKREMQMMFVNKILDEKVKKILREYMPSL